MPRRRRSKKWISKVFIVILLIIAGVVIYLVWDSYFRDKGSDNDDGGETSQVVDNKTSIKDDTTDTNEGVPEKKAVQYEGESPNELDILTGVVNYAGVNGNKLMIRTSIYQYLESGSCELVVTQGGTTVYTETVDIINDATTSTCKGFDVSVSSLTSGSLQFVIYISSGERTGEISGEASI